MSELSALRSQFRCLTFFPKYIMATNILITLDRIPSESSFCQILLITRS